MRKKLFLILLLPLFMSCKIGNENIPLPTGSPSASIQPSPSPTESLEPSPIATPSVIPSSPVPTSRFSPGSVFIDIYYSTIVLGNVYDQDGNLVNGAKVETNFFRNDEIINENYTTYTLDGTFVSKYISLKPYEEIKFEITVSKEGYKTVTRIVTVKHSFGITEEQLKSGKLPNTFNFGGTGEEAKYALVKIE